MDDVRKLVKVKPLEWQDWSARHRVMVVAQGYTITQRHFPDAHFVIEQVGQNPLPPSDTLEAAKAAAQADHEARIYAALTPASDGRAEALREAIAEGMRIATVVPVEQVPAAINAFLARAAELEKADE